MDPVVVVGAGISGVACARTLQQHGIEVRVVDRGRRIGGRMASRRIDGRVVDLGASYFTVADRRFESVVQAWEAAGLAEPWTDTFHVLQSGAEPATKRGPMRWRAPDALRVLVEQFAEPLDVRHGPDEAVTAVTAADSGLRVDGVRASAVILAMPDRQAGRVLGEGLTDLADALTREWQPTLVLVASFAERTWDTWGHFDGAFVGGDADLTWVADDGRRRGDDAPVLVAHSTADVARRHLDDPQAATPELLSALRRLLQLPEPVSTHVRRWGPAQPTGERPASFLLDDRLVGVCGDGWGLPKVEGAFLSGAALGDALAHRLSAGRV